MLKYLKLVIFLTTTFILFLNINISYADNIKNSTNANLLFTKGEQQYNAGNYDLAIISFTSAYKKFQEFSDWDNYLKSLIEIGHCYRRKGDFGEGLKYANIAEVEASKYYNKKNIIFSDIYHLQGSLIANSGDYNGSINYFTKSINIKTSVLGKKDTNLSTSYNNLGNTYFFLGKYDKALAYYKKAIEIAHNRILYSVPEVAMFNLSGAITLSIIGEIDQAKYHYAESLRIGRKTLAENDDDLLRIYMNIGNFLIQLGRYDLALNLLNAVKESFINKFGSNYYELGFIYTNIGNIYGHKGDNDKATDFFFKALDVYKSNYPNDHPEIASTYMNIGHCFYAKKKFEKAISYYCNSIKNTDNTFTHIRTYRNTGRAYEQLKETEQAELYFEKAIQLSEKLLGNKHYETGISYINKGEFYFNHNKKEKSIELYFKALNIFKTVFGNKHHDVAFCNSNIGYYYYSEKKYEEALKYYQQAIISLNINFNNNDVYANPETNKVLLEQNLIRPLHQKARTLIKLWQKTSNIKDLKAGLNTYIATIKLLDKIRTSYTQSSSLELGSKTNTVYTEAIKVCLDLYSIKKDYKYKEIAFELSEKSKAAVLLSAIKEIQAKNFGQIPQSFIIYENEIEKEIAEYVSLIDIEEQSNNPSEKKLRLLRSKLLALKQKKEALEDFLNINYPAYFNLKYNTDVIKLNELQKQLTKNQTIIEYTLSDSIIYIFLISKEQYEIEEVKADSLFYKNISFFRSSISNNKFSDINKDSFDKFVNSSYKLYEKLIKPIERHITNDQLIIIPGGELGYIPFESLITKLPNNKIFDYRSLHYLLYKYSTSYSISATMLYSKTKNNTARKEVIAFSPQYKTISSAIHKNDTALPRQFLSPLPEAIKEVNAIGKYFKTDVYTKELATESNFKKEVSKYDIIHLAMHTIIDDNNPMYSKLVFSHPDNNKAEDGYLNTYEIFNLDLNARLAVLSACNTGYGKLLTSEGILSMARGFIYAGCPSIIMTLWTVEDKTSSELINSFYKYLNSGMTKDMALRQAKLDHLKNADQLKAHPFFWSGYVNIGDTAALTNEIWFYKYNKIIILISSIAVLIILIKRKRIFYKIFNRN
jgi:CHAT domain-containing protein/tetratricopeptide (TPR) repeat protein